ncbi:LysR substrate-binding domain-containing protein [Chitinophaga sancti]|uniref:DNA-binding transcriptional regulator, LysR family n=1 Tax=Chitinophaga sancti TaxID=1004 RepID=A0A1K1RGL0_9BACT|nr:LysR substrate-binding domain-containing protein [Chitinophaga sancti]WQD60602.1 LysR substrate-binding domain-containing protein [Chitinophaga sancti]WQG87270.1 LysR substrate-binding domain-containing protein [Chitinophaga sancti]SFW71386.1 DNA-binding transcriptional regulator, LysR family [Chitinophaga sancti]
MLDFRLKVFYTVARRLSFTKAAEELFISQPAVTKHIHELEQQLGMALFERIGNRIKITRAGQVMLKHADDIFTSYRNLEYEINQLKHEQGGLLALGASTTIAQYFIPPLLAQFNQRYPEVAASLISGNTEQVEQALFDKSIQLGLIEGRSKNPVLKYVEIAKDEIALIGNVNYNYGDNNGPLGASDLKNIPLLMREHGSGTLEVINDELKRLKLKLTDLQIAMYMGSTESIKSYLHHAPCAAFLSLKAVQRELEAGEFKILPVKNFKLLRKFHFIYLQGQQDKLAQLFMRFARQHAEPQQP